MQQRLTVGVREHHVEHMLHHREWPDDAVQAGEGRESEFEDGILFCGGLNSSMRAKRAELFGVRSKSGLTYSGGIRLCSSVRVRSIRSQLDLAKCEESGHARGENKA